MSLICYFSALRESCKSLPTGKLCHNIYVDVFSFIKIVFVLSTSNWCDFTPIRFSFLFVCELSLCSFILSVLFHVLCWLRSKRSEVSYYWKSLYFQRNVLRIRTQEEQLNTSVIHLRVYVLLWINNVKPNSQDWYEPFSTLVWRYSTRNTQGVGHVVNLKKLFAYKKAPKNSLSSSSFSALLTISL